MIADLPPYPKMKDSGVPWLGVVPAYWDVSRLRNAAEMRVSNVDKHEKEGEIPVRLANYVDVYKHERIRASMNFMRATATVDEIDRFRLQTGDVLITKDSETWNDIGVPAIVEQSAEDLVCGYHLAVLRPFSDRLLADYLFRTMQSTGVAYQFHVEANGVTRYGLSHAAIKSIWLPVPPLPEQSIIVRFLDYVDRRIRRYILARQKRIKLLEEYKQAVIHQAVTGQINVRAGKPYPAYKDSGAEWLGQVPEHWEARKLKYAVSFSGGGTPAKSNEAFWQGTIPWVSPKDMGHDRIADATDHITEKAVAGSATSIVDPGAVLVVVRSGILRRRIPAAINTTDVALNQDMKALRPRDGYVVSEYLLAWIRGNENTLLQEWTKQGATVESIEHELLANSLLLIPTASEQRSITAYINDAVKNAAKAIDGARMEISLLREYRTRLIADVVTGKLDVRKAAAQLPGEPEEVELFDETDAVADPEEIVVDEAETESEESEA